MSCLNTAKTNASIEDVIQRSQFTAIRESNICRREDGVMSLHANWTTWRPHQPRWAYQEPFAYEKQRCFSLARALPSRGSDFTLRQAEIPNVAEISKVADAIISPVSTITARMNSHSSSRFCASPTHCDFEACCWCTGLLRRRVAWRISGCLHDHLLLFLLMPQRFVDFLQRNMHFVDGFG